MTIASNYEPEVKAADGAQLVFPFDFVWISNSVVIYQLTVEGARLLIDPQTYEITPGGTSPIFQGGTITFLAPEDAPSAPAIEVVRITDQTQLVDYTAYGPFPGEVTEFAFDKATMISQELQLNPVPPELSEFIPLSGTVDGRPVTGDIQFTTALEETGLLWDADGTISTLRPETLFGILYCRSEAGIGIVGGDNAATILVGTTGSVTVTTTAASGTTFNGPSVNINGDLTMGGGGEILGPIVFRPTTENGIQFFKNQTTDGNGILRMYMDNSADTDSYVVHMVLSDHNTPTGIQRDAMRIASDQLEAVEPNQFGFRALALNCNEGNRISVKSSGDTRPDSPAEIVLQTAGRLKMLITDLPETDPNEAGQLWRIGTALQISLG